MIFRPNLCDIDALQELMTGLKTGHRLLCCMVEISQKLCCYVTPDSASRLEAEKAGMLAQFESLSQDVNAALENLTGRQTASSEFQKCVDDIQMWLTKAESDLMELVSRTQLCHDPGVRLEQLRALLMELEGNRKKLDQLGKCCGTADAQQFCDGFCERYKNLTLDLMVRSCLLYCIIAVVDVPDFGSDAAGPASGNFCQIPLRQNFLPDFWIWQILAQLQCTQFVYS